MALSPCPAWFCHFSVSLIFSPPRIILGIFMFRSLLFCLFHPCLSCFCIYGSVKCFFVFHVDEKVPSLHLRVGGWVLTTMCAHAPRCRSEQTPFLESLDGDSMVLLEDVCAHQGSDSETWKGAIRTQAGLFGPLCSSDCRLYTDTCL